MKNLIYLISILFFMVNCTSTTSVPVENTPVQGQDSNPANTFPIPTPVSKETILSRSLEYSYSEWKKEFAELEKNKRMGPESLILAKEFLLGQALRSTPYVDDKKPEMLLTIRADFKNRQGSQSEADFLPLAKKILEQN